MTLFRRIGLAGSSALVAAGFVPAAVPSLLAQEPLAVESTERDDTPLQTADQSIAIDAQWYARDQGVSQEEAVRRLRIQRDMGPLIEQLRSLHQLRLAGVVVDHKPGYRLRIRLTGDLPVPSQTLAVGGSQLPVVFETGAKATHQALISALAANLPALATMFPTLDGVGIDQSTSEIVLTVYAADAAAAAAATGKLSQAQSLLGQPSRIETTDVREQLLDVRGGSRLSQSGGTGNCTSGFVVKNTAGTTGVATAGHCEGITLYYNPNGTTISIPIVASSEVVDADQDVEVHTSSYVERPEFYADTMTTARVLTGRRYRSSTAYNDNVCHRGITTGYSCGYVQQTDYAPNPTDPTFCGGVACAAVYVRVTGSQLACAGGDSGGSVFASTVAFGLLKTGAYSGTAPGQCTRMTYMSTDTLSSGWSLLYGP